MKKLTLLSFFIVFVLSCNIHLGADRNNPRENKIYRLRLNPPPGSKYHFNMSNESKLDIVVSDKEVENIKKSDVAINYEINNDSAGDLILGMTYDKIHIYTKNGDVVTDMDAANGPSSIDPVEKMLGALKAAHILATIDSGGNVKSVKGYQEAAERILSGIDVSISDKAKAQLQWKQLIEQGIVKKNMDQLFKIFPDSAVHIGDKWKLFSTEKSDVNFTVKNFYTLKSIEDGVANIESEGEIATDSTSSNTMGYDVVSELKGSQEGIYAMDIKTGMLLTCNVTTRIEGTVQVMGRDAHVNMKTDIKIDGQKL